jgi:four helix bundle protein
MEQNKEKTNLSQGRSYPFGLKVIRLFHTISKQGEFILSKQLVRSGTSFGANIEEALAALLHITNPPPELHD